ncbi:MAG: BMP family ABC transporter substrate-binding protein, partial [Actinobacteria bacterium]|nr:BMP family ABC transporter substrate-binding protein [Actinomycetota bacterium]NIS29755.1 BMP family ABC transporter substrate-binding protein [Actinomycetota bacterium]NIU65071.1 BMP family ABC transporter substrate-binding protein [Actinomycetota bacterium]NIW26870.1 BMP family ABC transporter substrate-binding protein [Actinomycetota bacterium]NIX19427.1 BMP family ABC transporter substrate-binding protein [Actinomycetota bacterium]
ADYDLIIAGSTMYAEAMLAVADEHPDVDYALIDGSSDHPSVTSVRFAANEGSFLAGMAAALATESGTVGFVGGFPLPLIEEFRAGFEAGVHHVDPEIEVLATYV